jgi:hypothetical protein
MTIRQFFNQPFKTNFTSLVGLLGIGSLGKVEPIKAARFKLLMKKSLIILLMISRIKIIWIRAQELSLINLIILNLVISLIETLKDNHHNVETQIDQKHYN